MFTKSKTRRALARQAMLAAGTCPDCSGLGQRPTTISGLSVLPCGPCGGSGKHR